MPSSAGGGSFRVDLERAPDAIRELDAALAELREIKKAAVSLGTINPGSRDSVSIDAARVLGLAAVGGAGSLVDALDAGIAQVDHLVTALRADLGDYGAADSNASENFDARLR